jgi:hypothetical protein
MWPFSPSNSDVIEQKRAERARALADGAKEDTEYKPIYLRATGLLHLSHSNFPTHLLLFNSFRDRFTH